MRNALKDRDYKPKVLAEIGWIDDREMKQATSNKVADKAKALMWIFQKLFKILTALQEMIKNCRTKFTHVRDEDNLPMLITKLINVKDYLRDMDQALTLVPIEVYTTVV
jgi:hypothetical protein